MAGEYPSGEIGSTQSDRGALLIQAYSMPQGSGWRTISSSDGEGVCQFGTFVNATSYLHLQYIVLASFGIGNSSAVVIVT